MKVVLDSNIIIAALAARGLSYAVYELCLKEHEIVVSDKLLEEVESALKSKLKMPPELASIFVDLIKRSSVVGTSAVVDESACRDRNDLHVLGLAEKAKAGMIITGNDDLLEIRSFKGTPVLSPREFWMRERKKDTRSFGPGEATKPKKIHEGSGAKYGVRREAIPGQKGGAK